MNQEAAADDRSCVQVVVNSDVELLALKTRYDELEILADDGDSDAEEELGQIAEV